MTIRREDLDFLLFDWLDARALLARPAFAHLDADTVDSMIDASLALAASQFASHAAKSDANEPFVRDGRVVLIPEIERALQAYAEAGLFGMEAPVEEGGLGLPYTLVSAIGGSFSAANSPTNSYPFLTQAAANLIRASASDEQKRRFLPPMNEGRWFGTMALSEPHAGSSVGDIRTQATPRADGTYSIRGTKTWISAGEHEMGGNIVHMLLAKIPGGPPGTKGISLSIVPKFRVDAEGRAGARNGVTLVGLNHKLGYRGTTNCLLNFGEDGECVGELVGAPHEGMRQMFRMMNEARIGVGIAAAAIGYAGWRAALAYARERTQGRAAEQRDSTSPMVPLVAHADVRRMLLRAKSYAEGALALCLYAARLVDEAHDGDAEAQVLLDLLTPIVKAWPSDYALAANDIAIQVLGGAGYTRDFPVERLWRDNRLNAIHEGTNGIQSLDLLGRKILGDGGRALGLLAKRIGRSLERASTDAELAPLGAAIGEWLPDVERAVASAAATMQREGPGRALANSYLLLDALGHCLVAWLWLDQALVARRELARDGVGDARRALLEGKLEAARYFIAWELPTKRPLLALFAAQDRTVLEADPARW
ncbi:MAG TPA: acyl-CoA dehydrogenase [Xanthomonadales bacterium]|nr:acyl-CoA dehydrogenase [Xanthomonadales bacterium]